jgi:acylaminoacyl-peptidase
LFVLRWADHDQSYLLADRPKTTLYALNVQVNHLDVTDFGQGIFASETLVYATGYSEMPNGRKLGIRGCNNRPASIYRLKLDFKDAGDGVETGVEDGTSNAKKKDPIHLDVQAVRVSDPNRSSRSPRLGPTYNTDGTSKRQLVWISNALLGPHASCSQLHSCAVAPDSLTSDEIEVDKKVVIDTVQKPSSCTPFPGLYLDQLPVNPFFEPFALLLNTVWGSKKTILTVSLSERNRYFYCAQQMGTTQKPVSRTFLNWFRRGQEEVPFVLFSESSPTKPNRLLLAKMLDLTQWNDLVELEEPEVDLDGILINCPLSRIFVDEPLSS